MGRIDKGACLQARVYESIAICRWKQAQHISLVGLRKFQKPHSSAAPQREPTCTKKKLTNMTINSSVIDAQINALAEKQAKRQRAGLTDDQRAAKREKKAIELAAKRAKKAIARAERAAQKHASHTKVIEKAEKRLPQLADSSRSFIEQLTGLDTIELGNIATHLNHIVRKRSISASINVHRIQPGDSVKINVGPPNLIGKLGTVNAVKRTRCYVDVSGFKTPAYLFLDNVERVAPNGITLA